MSRLDELLAAARETSAIDARDGRATRDRVLASLRPAARRPARWRMIAAAIAASLGGATAFAWYARPHAVRMSDDTRVVAAAAAVRVPPARPPHVAAPAEPVGELAVAVVAIDAGGVGGQPDDQLGAAAPAAPPPSIPVTPAAAPAAPPTPAPGPRSVPPPRAHRSRSAPDDRAPDVRTPDVAPSSPAAPAPDRELADYERAHARHFRDGDWAAALAAWDAYLARWPDGQLGPEARFNRAVCLVRLGRWDAADQAVQQLERDPATARRADVDRLRAMIDAARP